MSTRHQCVALIKILRGLAHRQVDEYNYTERQALVTLLSDPFEKLRAGGSDPTDIQQSIKLVRRALRNHLKSSSDIGPGAVIEIAGLMDEARTKDEANIGSTSSFTFIKTRGDNKKTVEFILHETGGRKQLWDITLTSAYLGSIIFRVKVKRVLPDTDFTDWIINLNKDSGKPRITPLDNVHFYVGFGAALNDVRHTGLLAGVKFQAKRAVSDFQEIQQSRGSDSRIYALVDRNPQVHILFFIDNQLLAIFSLAMRIPQKLGSTVLVFKDVDGTLYHSQHIMEELILGKMALQRRVVYWLDAGMNKIPIDVPVKPADLSNELSQICDQIIEASKSNWSARWLVELHLCPVHPCIQPALTAFKVWKTFLGQQENPFVQAMIHGAERTVGF